MHCHLSWKPTRAGRRGPIAVIARSEEGFTLIEMLASGLVVALIAASVATALVASAHVSGDQRNRSAAHELAQRDQERLRGLSAEELNTYNTPQSQPAVTINGTSFTVTSKAVFMSASGASCSSGAAAYYSATSTVSWGQGSLTEQSLITPPAGGTLIVQVRDQTGGNLAGASVAAQGPDYEAGTTDSNGCVVLSALLPGTYTATVTDPGYVDPTSNPSPTGSSTVTSTGISTLQPTPIVLGQAGQITGNLVDANAPTTLQGEATGLSWFGAGSAAQMASSATAPSSATLATQFSTPAAGTQGSLYPFYFTTSSNYNNNYEVWGGRCIQEEPPSAITADKFTVNPGSAQSASVQEPELDLLVVKNSTNTQIAPSHVRITFNSTSGTPSCSETWLAPIAANAATGPTALAYPGVPFATNITSGSGASASGYTGALTVCADSSGTGTKNSVTFPDSFPATHQTINVNGTGSTSGTC
jgi:type II secretory pathway pseudopilin PulG